MKEKDVYSELSSIRNLMERSSKFISLSGLAGVLAGLYALLGAGLGYMLMNNIFETDGVITNRSVVVWQLFMIALTVLVFSVVTACWLTIRNAKNKRESVWNPVSRRLLTASGVPLVTGGLFILIMLMKGEYAFIAAACLIFYGLALFAGSHYTFVDIKWLGFCQILLGLIALIVPVYGLILWAIGFGVLHIIYGGIMHFKYER
ncbi:MAG: hypothetical protein WBJ10_14845 [Daejeonella sp.]|uniref:hypothetical protein n=1 Tax=Daejeonella sp. TaxID=2805397 RepID=UPI003C73CBE2